MKALLSVLFLVLVTGCGASIEIRNDPSPSPLDTHYHTMLMQSSCFGKMEMGQAGCSFEEGEDLSSQTLTILSPLGGSVLLYSKECAVDRKDYIPKGQKVDYRVAELIPPGVKYCAFSLFTYWEKPKEVETEYPFRGQSGKFYVRIRPKGSGKAGLQWLPYAHPGPKSGMFYGQFREDSADREAIQLKVTLTHSVEKGLFELWSEAKQIGFKSAEYSGKEILIPRERILGSAKQGSYLMLGWAVGANPELDNDFAVHVDVFGKNTSKLSGKLSFEEKKVCFETENVVSLVLLSGVEKASNEVKGCFPKPEGEAVMAFFTNVGRAAYAFIKGETYEWVQ